MKLKLKRMLGATLLEILLVLAIAAMIIVLSIRYYQSSTTSHQANATMESIQAITSSMDNLAQGGAGSYSGITATTLEAVMGSANMMSAANMPITYTPIDENTYSVAIPLNDAVCTSVLAKIQSNAKITNSTCNAGTLSYTYDNTK